MSIGTLRLSTSLVCLYIILLLSACGGGGGGNAQNVTPAPVITDAAMITGSVLAVSNADVDSDVNDPLAPSSINDSFDSAQVIANFTNLGGYLNQPNQGAPGRSFDIGDANDFFEVNLVAGQSIALIMAESSANNDIDLTLFDSNQVVVDQSMNNDRGECVENVVAGRHFIQANIIEGASNYALSVTSLPCAATFASRSLRLDSDFKPGELVAVLRDAESAPAMRTELAALAMDMVLIPHRQYAKISMDNAKEVAKKMDLAVQPGRYASELAERKAATLLVAKALQSHGDIEYIEPNYIYRSFASANDPFFQRQWHYPLINLPDAWDQAVGGSGAVVAVLDTGVLTSHPDLVANLLPGYDFISDPDAANDGGGRDSDPSDPGDSLVEGLSSFHGSHVLGTVAAVANNDIGVSGAAFYSNIRAMPLRVLGVGGGTFSDICEALRYAARLPNASNTLPAVAADVINMSLGAEVFSQAFQDCITETRNQGIIIVAASGNFSSSAPSYPAAHNGVVSVSAVDLTRSLANYSNFGPTIDVAAPGGEASDDDGDGLIDGVFSTIGDELGNGDISNTFGYLIGTSMAAPHVSAVAALMKSVAPSLTPDQFDAFLTAGELTDDLGLPGRDDNFGFGLINANKAVLRAQGMSLTTPLLSVAPSGINFGLSESLIEVNVRNVGGGDLLINSVSENSGGWLSVVGPAGGNEGVYTLAADRASPLLASPGFVTATLSVRSNGGDIDLPILIEVLQAGQSDSANAGRQFIFLSSLTDPDNSQLLAMQVNNGRYDFQFDAVAEDIYLLFAGTNNDNDEFVCDRGEACGALGSLDEPFVVQVQANSSIDVGSFFTSFDFVSSLSSASATATSSEALVLPK